MRAAHVDPAERERAPLVAPGARAGTVRLACASASASATTAALSLPVPSGRTGGLGGGGPHAAAARAAARARVATRGARLVWCAVGLVCVGALAGLTVGLYFALSAATSDAVDVLGGVGDLGNASDVNGTDGGGVDELVARASARNQSAADQPVRAEAASPSSPLCPSSCALCCVVDTSTLEVPIRIAEFVDLLPCDDPQIEALSRTPLKPKETCVRESCRRDRCRGFFRSRSEFDTCVDWVPPNYTALAVALSG